MRTAAFTVACLLGVASAVNPLQSQKLVDEINSNPASTWRAGINERFAQWTVEEMKQSMGAVLTRDESLPTVDRSADVSLPSSFDSRTEWKGCIGPIMDQAKCGSCWAFGAAEAISDRMCIEGVSKNYTQLAPLDLVACDNGFFNNGCQGGQPSAAWQWAQSNGLVTEPCLPYLKSEGGPIPTCAPADEPCMPNTFVNTPSCNPTCKNGASYSGDKHKISNVYNVGSNAQAMMAELVSKGPMEVAMTVYSDFVHYKSGVYKHTTGSALGGHAIKLIGYGTLNGEDYWLVQNSWTTTWGDKGLFMIARGTDECGIEDSPVAGTWK